MKSKILSKIRLAVVNEEERTKECRERIYIYPSQPRRPEMTHCMTRSLIKQLHLAEHASAFVLSVSGWKMLVAA